VSFILDALKKSENERQRKAGPALYEVKLAPPRNRLPWWMITVGALLGVNLIVVLWLLIRSPSPAAAPVVASASAPSPAGSAPVTAPVAPPPAQTGPPATTTNTPPPTLNGSGGPPASIASDDLAPAVEPTPDPAERVHTTTEAGLPSYQEAAARNSRIPALHLDFHLYAAKPQDRFVFINMKKMHEGDAMPDGVRVESINDEGAVLSFEGTRFTLLHE